MSTFKEITLNGVFISWTIFLRKKSCCSKRLKIICLFSNIFNWVFILAIISSFLKGLVIDHVNETGSDLSKRIIKNFDEEKKTVSKERIERKARLLFDLSRQYAELRRFVNAMVLGGNELSEGEGVNLLTVHASKGLEFPEVYVIDLVDGRFPNRKMMSSIEEERRLFYVAVTRAKDKLYLSLARFDKVKKIDYKPSQFLHEAGLIKGEFVEPDVKKKAGGRVAYNNDTLS